MIKLLICDGDGTLGLPNPSREIREMLDNLDALGIKLAVASNSPRAEIVQRFQRANLPVPNIIVTRATTGARKPSPLFVDEVIQQSGVKRTEIAYLGDDDETDIFCATNSRVLPFSAQYSTANEPRQYGIPVNHPKALTDYLRTFSKQPEPYFGWTYQNTTNQIDARTLIYDQGAELSPILRRVLKGDQENVLIGSNDVAVRSLLFHYLVSQCYMSGLVSEMDFVSVYPGHEAGTSNALLEDFSDNVRLSFRTAAFLPNLIVRHTTAPKSSQQGHARNIYDQFRTININPAYREKIAGKSVLVLDDYTTYGYSAETARKMLLMAGASKVTAVAIAKWHWDQYFEANTQKAWNAFEPCTLQQAAIPTILRHGTPNPIADNYFKNQIWTLYSA